MNYRYLAVGVLAFLVGVVVDPTPPQSELLAAVAYLAAGGYVMLGVGREVQAHRQRKAEVTS